MVAEVRTALGFALSVHYYVVWNTVHIETFADTGYLLFIHFVMHSFYLLYHAEVFHRVR